MSPRFCKRHDEESNEEGVTARRACRNQCDEESTRRVWPQGGHAGTNVEWLVESRVARLADTYNRYGFLNNDGPSVNARVDEVNCTASDGATGLKRLLLGVHPYRRNPAWTRHRRMQENQHPGNIGNKPTACAWVHGRACARVGGNEGEAAVQSDGRSGRTLEGWQQRGVDVQESALPLVHKGRSQHPHEPSEADQLNIVLHECGMNDLLELGAGLVSLKTKRGHQFGS